MVQRDLPFTVEDIDRIASEHPTPFHLYDEEGIRRTCRDFRTAFSWAPGFMNYYAVKALPNPWVLRIVREEGMGFDASSLAELELSDRIGVSGEDIMLTSNNTPAEYFQRARELGAVINLDDESHIDYLAEHAGMPDLICFRYNPGPLKEGNTIIGRPEEAKYGFTREQLFSGYQRARELGATRFGLHTMVASNELDPAYFAETARILFELALDLEREIGIRIEFVNLGGGIGIPYRPEDKAVDLYEVSRGIRAHYNQLISGSLLDPLRIVMENGRAITGPHGYLVSRVRHEKNIYRRYLGLDADMAHLMRPGMYGAYHHISVLGTPGREPSGSAVYDVTGSLCENNDKFAIQRVLPEARIGDYVVIHDTGAHGHSMGFNYNGKLRSAELLLKTDGSSQLIRRAETLQDYFRTIEDTELPADDPLKADYAPTP